MEASRGSLVEALVECLEESLAESLAETLTETLVETLTQTSSKSRAERSLAESSREPTLLNFGLKQQPEHTFNSLAFHCLREYQRELRNDDDPPVVLR